MLSLNQFEDAEKRRQRMEFIKKDFWEKMKELRDPNEFKLQSEIVDSKKLEGVKKDFKDNLTEIEEVEIVRKRLELSKMRLRS